VRRPLRARQRLLKFPDTVYQYLGCPAIIFVVFKDALLDPGVAARNPAVGQFDQRRARWTRVPPLKTHELS
jgi:hypothetical protein